MGGDEHGVAIRSGGHIVVYGHVENEYVEAGDMVMPGANVATVGAGHLHLEVRKMALGADPLERHNMFCNPLGFFEPAVLQEMNLTWQPYVDSQGNLSVDYNEWTMVAYIRPGNWFEGTLRAVAWRHEDH